MPLFEGIGVAPGAIFFDPGHLLSPFAMPFQHRGRGAFDFASGDEAGSDASLPKLSQQRAPDPRKAHRNHGPDHDPIEINQRPSLRTICF